MAITETHPGGRHTELHKGRVVRIDHKVVRRNHSDTLDYTDFRDTDCTYALVWLGTHGHAPWEYDGMPFIRSHVVSSDPGPRELEPWEQFAYVDCTNLFAWRGEAVRKAEVDLDIVNDPSVDPTAWMAFTIWEAKRADDARKAQERLAELERQEAAKAAERERNRPVPGKKMIVKSGRKVPIGTTGTVAYVHHNGGVLLKDDKDWKVRAAPGIWVNARHLEAR